MAGLALRKPYISRRAFFVGLALLALVSGLANWVTQGRLSFLLWKKMSGLYDGKSYADINGIKLYYETFGKGSPVLVMHGGLGSHEQMHFQITELARDHLVIAPDSRGHGRSSDGAGPLRYSQMAADMIALMDRLHIEKADVIGWSDGGIIGLDMAIEHPDRVAHLVTMGANFDVKGLIDENEPPPPPTAIDEVVNAGRSALRGLEPSPERKREDAFARKVVLMWHNEPHFTLAELGKISAPTLVMAGEHDVILPEHTNALARAIPGAEEIIVPGASHGLPIERPGIVNAAIRRFIDTIPDPA